MVELPSAGVELMRLLLDGTPPTPLPSVHLPALYRGVQSDTPESRVLRVLWKQGESILLLTPGTQPQHVLHVQEGRILTGSNALSLFYSQKEDPVIAEWYYPRKAEEKAPPGPVSLVQAYNALLLTVLTRYRDLVGQHLVNSALFNLNTQLMTRGAPARITPFGWEITSESLDETTLVALIRTINTSLLAHMEHVLGPRLSRDIFQEARSRLSTDYQSLLDAHRIEE